MALAGRLPGPRDERLEVGGGFRGSALTQHAHAADAETEPVRRSGHTSTWWENKDLTPGLLNPPHLTTSVSTSYSDWRTIPSITDKLLTRSGYEISADDLHGRKVFHPFTKVFF